jgi:hypothetical protein
LCLCRRESMSVTVATKASLATPRSQSAGAGRAGRGRPSALARWVDWALGRLGFLGSGDIGWPTVARYRGCDVVSKPLGQARQPQAPARQCRWSGHCG